MKPTDRRKGALQRLEAQLASGVKTEKKSNKKVPLTESDKNRIQKEMDILKKKV